MVKIWLKLPKFLWVLKARFFSIDSVRLKRSAHFVLTWFRSHWADVIAAILAIHVHQRRFDNCEQELLTQHKDLTFVWRHVHVNSVSPCVNVQRNEWILIAVMKETIYLRAGLNSAKVIKHFRRDQCSPIEIVENFIDKLTDAGEVDRSLVDEKILPVWRRSCFPVNDVRHKPGYDEHGTLFGVTWFDVVFSAVL